MATKSFLKNITIKSKRQCHELANALENAKAKKAKSIVSACKVRTATAEEVKNLFAGLSCSK